MAATERLPRPVKSSLGVVGLVVGIVGVAVGYIFLVLGVTTYYDLNGIQALGALDAAIVVISGVVSLALGYLGWRSFMRFAY